MGQLRSVRVAPDPPSVRIAGAFGRLVDVSATGALVQVQQSLTAEREWRMIINLDPEPVEVRVRVVRSASVPVRLADATWDRQEFAIGLMFTDMSAKAWRVIKRLCGEAFSKRE